MPPGMICALASAVCFGTASVFQAAATLASTPGTGSGLDAALLLRAVRQWATFWGSASTGSDSSSRSSPCVRSRSMRSVQPSPPASRLPRWWPPAYSASIWPAVNGARPVPSAPDSGCWDSPPERRVTRADRRPCAGRCWVSPGGPSRRRRGRRPLRPEPCLGPRPRRGCRLRRG